jgi:hypothetical protein
MAEWENGILEKLQENKHDAQDYQFYIDLIKSEIIETINCCQEECHFCCGSKCDDFIASIFEERGIK